MAVTYTSNLKLALPVTGTEIGAWGDIVNQSLTNPVDQAISGTVSLTSMTNADYTLANGDGALTNEARYMALLVPATLTLTAARNIIVPNTSKLYLVVNSSVGGFAVTVKTVAGGGVSVPNGTQALLYCDGTSVSTAVSSIPTGTINMWSTDTAPTGWLLADGSDVSRTVYSSLFAVIGTTFGSGSGSTFTLPNYTNRMPIGSGGAYALAATGGSANAVVVSHSHTATSTVTDPSHAHNATAGVFVLNGAGGVDTAGGSGFISGGSGSATTATATTGVTVSTSVSTEGSSATNANLPPYLGIRFIIKT